MFFSYTTQKEFTFNRGGSPLQSSLGHAPGDPLPEQVRALDADVLFAECAAAGGALAPLMNSSVLISREHVVICPAAQCLSLNV